MLPTSSCIRSQQLFLPPLFHPHLTTTLTNREENRKHNKLMHFNNGNSDSIAQILQQSKVGVFFHQVQTTVNILLVKDN